MISWLTVRKTTLSRFGSLPRIFVQSYDLTNISIVELRIWRADGRAQGIECLCYVGS